VPRPARGEVLKKKSCKVHTWADHGVVGTYHQYCPIARTSEILAERWTPLIIRNLSFGASTFSDIAHGVPQMSSSMLAKRLRELERAGVMVRTVKENGLGHHYALTEAGRDLGPLLEAFADWGERWVEVTPEHADPGFALWAWCRVQLNQAALPSGRHVVAFVFPDQPAGNRHYWLLVDRGTAEVCYSDPGGEIEVEVRADSSAFVDWHRGRLPWGRALRAGSIAVTGDRRLAQAIPGWNLRAVALP
jgi:DNA-binding HxlR family transcriptional regulator